MITEAVEEGLAGEMPTLISDTFPDDDGIDNFEVDASKVEDVPGYGGGGGSLPFACEEDGVEELGKILRLHDGLALSDSDDDTCVEFCEVFDVGVCCCCLAACVW